MTSAARRTANTATPTTGGVVFGLARPPSAEREAGMRLTGVSVKPRATRVVTRTRHTGVRAGCLPLSRLNVAPVLVTGSTTGWRSKHAKHAYGRYGRR